VDWLGPVAVLALVDGTSIGTLVIPLWLMLAPRIRPAPLLAYLGTVAAAYFVLGLLILGGITVAADALADGLASRPGQVLRLLLGVALVVLGLTIEPLTKAGKAQRAAQRQRRIDEQGPTRWQRWRAEATTGEATVGALMLLALTAVAIEAASMVPYLAALGIVATADLGQIATLGVLAGYCLVMIGPALLILTLRLALHERIAPALGRVEAWLSRNSRETVAWVLFLLGLWLAVGAAAELGLL
jgi:hypothetical protein